MTDSNYTPSPFHDAGVSSSAGTFGETGFKLDTTVLDRIVRDLGTNEKDVVTDLAFQIETDAKMRAPYLTSAMLNSIYVVTKDEDNYSTAANKAKSKNPKVTTNPLPKPTGKTIANVGPCVDYALYVELGTSRKAARPFLVPAVEKIFHKFNSGETWRRLFK